MSRAARPLLIVCSSGGHLLQMLELRDAWSSLRARLGDVRQVRRALAAARRARGARLRPDQPQHPEPAAQPPARRAGAPRASGPAAILTTGAGVAVPFAWVGRLLGIPTVYVESVTRIEGLSLSARLIAPVATRMYAQWPELAEPSGGPHPLRRQPLRGPMIVVTVGTNEQPFDRLVRAAAALGGDEPLLVQYGSSRVPHGRGEWVDFLPFDELAGAGARRARVRLPRRRRLDHARAPLRPPAGRGAAARTTSARRVDDHQLALARRLARGRARDAGRGRARAGRARWPPAPGAPGVVPRRAPCRGDRAERRGPRARRGFGVSERAA